MYNWLWMAYQYIFMHEQCLLNKESTIKSFITASVL